MKKENFGAENKIPKTLAKKIQDAIPDNLKTIDDTVIIVLRGIYSTTLLAFLWYQSHKIWRLIEMAYNDGRLGELSLILGTIIVGLFVEIVIVVRLITNKIFNKIDH